MNKKIILIFAVICTVTTVFGQTANPGDLISSGSNSWVFHTPDDGRNTLHIGRWLGSEWDWSNSFLFMDNGTLGLNSIEVAKNAVFRGPFIYNDYNGGRLTIAAADPNNAGINTIYSTTTGFAAYSELHLRGSSLAIKNSQGAITGYFSANGNVGIGTSYPTDKLSVKGNIRAQEIRVEAGNWPDYVFEDDYSLPDLYETERFIKAYKHLPGIPTADEVKDNGHNVGEMNVQLLKKIEELTLQMIKQQRQLDKQTELIDKLLKK